MLRRVSALIIRDDFVLLVKLKEQDRLIPRATWVFPFIDLDPDASPRKAISDMLSKFDHNTPASRDCSDILHQSIRKPQVHCHRPM